MATFDSEDDWPFDKEIQFCQFMQELFEDEPIYIKFIINKLTIKFFIYYSNETCDVFEDFLREMNINLEDFDLTNKQWDYFYVREFVLTENVENYDKCWEFVCLNKTSIHTANGLL